MIRVDRMWPALIGIGLIAVAVGAGLLAEAIKEAWAGILGWSIG